MNESPPQLEASDAFYRGANVVVTGAAGFVGMVLSELLAGGMRMTGIPHTGSLSSVM